MVSRADLAEVFFRQTLRPAASTARGSGGTARFSLEATEWKPVAPPRPASRRDETASARSEADKADRIEDARTEDARTRAARAERAATARSATAPESRAPAASARNRPAPARPGQDGMQAASARTPGEAAKAAAQRSERPAGDGTEPARAAAEEEAAKETGAAMASEEDARETKETDTGSPDAAAVADPAALLSPPVSAPVLAPAPTAAGAAIAGQSGAGAGEAAEAAGIAASGQAATSATSSATTASGDGSVSAAAGAAGFEAALTGMQDAAAATAPAPAGPAAALPPPGGGSAQGLHAAEAASRAAGANAAPPQPTTPPIPLGAVPMTIGLRSLSGVNRFAIRLDPVELGRIDVSLDLDKAGGKARAHLVVDRPETLALLQRDAGSLQQALAQAGFDVGAEAGGGGIDLSLRSETGSQGNRDGESAPRGRPETGPGRRDDGPAPLDRLPLRHLRAVSGVDIRI